MSKTIQVRVSKEEHSLIKTAFSGENISGFVRKCLLEEAERRLQEMGEVSVQTDDENVKSFLAVLYSQEVQLQLYNIFKSIHDETGNTSNV